MSARPPAVDNMTAIVLAGSIVLALSFGARSIFGVVLGPLSEDLAWPRETFALSLAIQNLVWGLAQPAFDTDRPTAFLAHFAHERRLEILPSLDTTAGKKEVSGMAH